MLIGGTHQVLTKQHPSSFAGTGLDSYLKEKGVKKVVLCGYMVSRCPHVLVEAAAMQLWHDILKATS